MVYLKLISHTNGFTYKPHIYGFSLLAYGETGQIVTARAYFPAKSALDFTPDSTDLGVLCSLQQFYVSTSALGP